jgi:ketosteroid isomerase-like protein
VRQLVQTYGANDLDTYFSIYAEDMTVMRAGGRWTHQGYHDLWTGRVEGGGGNLTAQVEDLVVQVLPGGESAIATFRMPVESRFPEGTDPSLDPRIVYYMTTVWALRNASWNIISVHWSVEP